MKMTKIISISFLSVLTLFSISTSGSAEETDGELSDPIESKATITFAPGEDAPKVMDPTTPDQEEPYGPDPTNPGDPQDAPTGKSGPLTLDYVSSIEFGEEKINAQTEIYESTTLRPFIQVSDRRGTGTGWVVTAQMSDFTLSNEETHSNDKTLPGSVLTFLNGEVASTSTSDEPTPHDPIELTPGGAAVNVVTAEPNKGLGSWITRWFDPDDANEDLNDNEKTNDNVTLTIPAGAATQGEHTATITWTLKSVPGVQDE